MLDLIINSRFRALMPINHVACLVKASLLLIWDLTLSVLRVYEVIDLRELPQAEFKLDLILHVHDEGECLDEFRGFG